MRREGEAPDFKGQLAARLTEQRGIMSLAIEGISDVYKMLSLNSAQLALLNKAQDVYRRLGQSTADSYWPMALLDVGVSPELILKAWVLKDDNTRGEKGQTTP